MFAMPGIGGIWGISLPDRRVKGFDVSIERALLLSLILSTKGSAAGSLALARSWAFETEINSPAVLAVSLSTGFLARLLCLPGEAVGAVAVGFVSKWLVLAGTMIISLETLECHGGVVGTDVSRRSVISAGDI
jgi:hypothetical protein